MPIKNYTTSVNATKTVAEIQTLLARHGARRVMLEYDGFGQPDAVAFDAEIEAGRMMPFLLRANVDGCLAALKKDKD